jgi:hypothetical protein
MNFHTDPLLKAANEVLSEGKEGTFQRLPGHVINNELYVAKRDFESIVNSLLKDSDYDDKRFLNLISKLQFIRKQAKTFKIGDKIPVAYEYKS